MAPQTTSPERRVESVARYARSAADFCQSITPIGGDMGYGHPGGLHGPSTSSLSNVPVSSPLINPWAEVAIPMYFEQSDTPGKEAPLPPQDRVGQGQPDQHQASSSWQ